MDQNLRKFKLGMKFQLEQTDSHAYTLVSIPKGKLSQDCTLIVAFNDKVLKHCRWLNTQPSNKG